MDAGRSLVWRSLGVAAIGAMVLAGGGRAVGEGASATTPVMTPGQLKWLPLPSLPAGAQVAILQGAPGKPGPYVARVRFPPHYRVPAHFHTDDRNYTFVSGTLYEGEGDTFTESALVAIPAGSFHGYTAGTRHFGATRDAEAVFQVNGNGPTDIVYVNPADDPRKK